MRINWRNICESSNADSSTIEIPSCDDEEVWNSFLDDFYRRVFGLTGDSGEFYANFGQQILDMLGYIEVPAVIQIIEPENDYFGTEVVDDEDLESPVSKVISPDAVDEIIGEFLIDREGEKFDCGELKDMILDYIYKLAEKHVKEDPEQYGCQYSSYEDYYERMRY